MKNLTWHQAEVARRVEDLRIATKHRVEAGSRSLTPENGAAWQRACAWEETCRDREQAARAALIRFNRDEVTTPPPKGNVPPSERLAIDDVMREMLLG